MFLKVELFILQIFGTDMSEQELKEQLGDELCEFCPWRKGEIDHTFDSLCEGSYCDDAFDNFLDEKIIPFIKPGGYVYIAVPGMKKDCHDDLPDELLLSWNEEQLDYIHDMDYWRNIVDKSNKSKVISIKQMEGNEELWTDWINCDNEYAAGDKKAVDAGACKYLNFISIVLQRVK